MKVREAQRNRGKIVAFFHPFNPNKTERVCVHTHTHRHTYPHNQKQTKNTKGRNRNMQDLRNHFPKCYDPFEDSDLLAGEPILFPQV